MEYSDQNIIVLSGGFDPIHSGHIAMFEESKKYGKIVVLLNSDNWLIKKKNKYFMSWEERYSVIKNINEVKDIIKFDDSDGTAVDGLKIVKKNYPNQKIYFANGGDRKDHNTPEDSFCQSNDIGLIYKVGGGKTQSSSNLLDNWKSYKHDRPWGHWNNYKEFNLINNEKAKIKSLTVKPHSKLSYQKHFHRNEHWFVIQGKAKIKLNDEFFNVGLYEHFYIEKEEWHQLINEGNEDLIIVEVQYGQTCEEHDIVRKD